MDKPIICCIFNQAAHYREPIYKLMDNELDCDFYITRWKINPFKQMDYHKLNNLKGVSKNIKIIGRFYWQSNAISHLFKPYRNYILIGDPNCISTWLILLLSLLLKKRIILWSHGWYGRESKPKSIIKKLFFGLSHHVLLYGNYAKELMIKEGFPANKLSCVYNSLDYDAQVALRNKLKPSDIYKYHFNNNYPTLIFTGRLTPVKRLDLLLDALAKLKSQSQYFNLILIGSGEKKDELLSLTKNLGLEENVWFYGACYDESIISKFIFNADLCVSPGNVGLTAIHAMSYGTPIITHNDFIHQMPEFEAIEEGISGTFFRAGDYNALAKSIFHWFSISHDRELIRKNCFKVIDSKYNPHFQIEVLKNIFNGKNGN